MDFFEVIESRYSVRAYKPDEIDEEKVERILHAARMAPTAVNKQPFHFIVIHTKGREKELKQIYHRDWFHQAPLVILACAKPDAAWSRRDGKNYADIDTTIAMDHLILAAASLGLGTCWVAAFDPQATRDILGLPNDVEPIAFTPLGYPADERKAKKRKAINELVSFERWSH